MDRRHTRPHSLSDIAREGGSRRSMVHGHPVNYRAENLAAARHGFFKRFLELIVHRAAVQTVRIHLPPAESQVQTCLSREFAFLGREATVFRGCPGRDEWPGSAETRGRGNIWPKRR